MKTQTITLCELTEKPVGNHPAILVQGKLLKHGGDNAVVVDGGTEGAVVLVSALVEALKGPTKPRRAKIDYGAEVTKLLTSAAKLKATFTMKDLAGANGGSDPNLLQAVITKAIEAKKIERVNKGVYRLPASS